MSARERHGDIRTLYSNAIVYSEFSFGFERIEDLERALSDASSEIFWIPKEACFSRATPPFGIKNLEVSRILNYMISTSAPTRR